jgi:hypothetical protein
MEPQSLKLHLAIALKTPEIRRACMAVERILSVGRWLQIYRTIRLPEVPPPEDLGKARRAFHTRVTAGHLLGRWRWPSARTGWPSARSRSAPVARPELDEMALAGDGLLLLPPTTPRIIPRLSASTLRSRGAQKQPAGLQRQIRVPIRATEVGDD